MISSTPFHLVTPSPWPILISLMAGSLTLSLVAWFHYLNYSLQMMTITMSMILFILYKWWIDVMKEASLEGAHTIMVQKGLRMGMVLFILSEIMFFLSFFWAFFHSSLAPTPDIGCIWPPTGISPINPFAIPLLNTALLLASGVSITWSHHEIMMNNNKESIYALIMTLFYGLFFTLIQLMEYKEATFSIADSIYGSSFFVATGFHGLHVIIGSTFISVALYRLYKLHFTKTHHFGFEAAAWYWHFVDVVWICLFLSMYWWGSL